MDDNNYYYSRPQGQIDSSAMINRLHNMQWLKRQANDHRFKSHDTDKVEELDGLPRNWRYENLEVTVTINHTRKVKEHKLEAQQTIDTQDEEEAAVMLFNADEWDAPNQDDFIECIEPPKEPETEAVETRSVWDPSTDVVNKLFPEAQILQEQLAAEDMMVSLALSESLEFSNLEKFKLDRNYYPQIPDPDEKEWGVAYSNLPEIAFNSSLQDKRGSQQNCDRSMGQHDRNNNTKSYNQQVKDLIPSDLVEDESALASGIRIDQYGRIQGYTERRMFMGKGARKKEQDFLQRNCSVIGLLDTSSDEAKEPHPETLHQIIPGYTKVVHQSRKSKSSLTTTTPSNVSTQLKDIANNLRHEEPKTLRRPRIIRAGTQSNSAEGSVHKVHGFMLRKVQDASYQVTKEDEKAQDFKENVNYNLAFDKIDSSPFENYSVEVPTFPSSHVHLNSEPPLLYTVAPTQLPNNSTSVVPAADPAILQWVPQVPAEQNIGDDNDGWLYDPHLAMELHQQNLDATYRMHFPPPANFLGWNDASWDDVSLSDPSQVNTTSAFESWSPKLSKSEGDSAVGNYGTNCQSFSFSQPSMNLGQDKPDESNLDQKIVDFMMSNNILSVDQLVEKLNAMRTSSTLASDANRLGGETCK